MLIRWSDEDQVYIVALPEFDQNAARQGETYVEAARQGLDALETLIEFYQEEGLPLPEPNKFNSPPIAQADPYVAQNPMAP